MVSVCTVPARGGRSDRWIQYYEPNTFTFTLKSHYFSVRIGTCQCVLITSPCALFVCYKDSLREGDP